MKRLIFIFLNIILPLNGVFAQTDCIIDLTNNTHTCGPISAISVLSSPHHSQSVVKVTLERAISNSGYAKAVFEVSYGSEPTGWTVNIGDSPSNNGWSGDGANQSHDSEMQILGTAMSLYGNDYTPEPRLLSKVDNIVTTGDTLALTVCNEYLAWESPHKTGELHSPYLYALNGQSDDEGPINYDIYAAFNRVIASSGRNGIGVSQVHIHLFPECEKANLVNLAEFSATSEQDNVHLKWITGVEKSNMGFRVWRGMEDNHGGYTIVAFKAWGDVEQRVPETSENCSVIIQGQLKENTNNFYQFISAMGNSTESTCYSFTDTNLLEEGTYYYVLEDIDENGNHTFHCDNMAATTIGHSSTINLEAAITYCNKLTNN
jgi:hypothetical protein